MGKDKMRFSEAERKVMISSAYKLYLVEMYLAQKATETIEVEVEGKKATLNMGDYLKDYETQHSLHTLAKMISMLEPKLWEKVKDTDSVKMVKETVVYLTGVDMWSEEKLQAEPKVVAPAKSDAEGAIMATDLTNKDKIKITKTIPKNLKVQ